MQDRPNDSYASTKPGSGEGLIISACVPAEAWFMHVIEVDAYSTGNAHVTETNYRRFTNVFTPQRGPVGRRTYDTTFHCPYCQTDLRVQLTVQTCLQYTRQEFRSDTGRRIRKFLLAKQLREGAVAAIYAPVLFGLIFGLLGGVMGAIAIDGTFLQMLLWGAIFGVILGPLLVLGKVGHVVFKLLWASEGKMSIFSHREIPPGGLEMIKVFVQAIDFKATDEMGENNKFHALISERPKANSKDSFSDRITLNESS